MGFRFSLETVLRLRQSLEDSERLRLQMLLADRAELQEEIGETAASRAAVGHKLKAALQRENPPAGELHFAAQRERACGLQSARLSASLATVMQQIERQQTVLLRRRIDRKVLEQLRERQLSRYEVETRRRTQSQIEELFLLRKAISN